MKSEVILSSPVGPKRGETCRITIETKEHTYVWEGEFFDAEWNTEYVEVAQGFAPPEYIPVRQHLRLHLVK